MDILQLARVTVGEGRQLAERVRRGEITRAEVEEAHRQYPCDLEPLIALHWLDRWPR